MYSKSAERSGVADSNPLNILLVSAEYPPETGGGGIGSYIASIAPALAARGHTVHVLSFVNGQEDRDYEDRRVHIHRRGRFPLRNLSRLIPLLIRVTGAPKTIHRLTTALSAFLWHRDLGLAFDVVEYPDWGAEGLFFALANSKPLVAHLHTPLPVISRYHDPPDDFDNRLATALESYAIHHADIVTSPSNLLVQELEAMGWLRGTAIDVIPHPIDPLDSNIARTTSETKPVVLFVGRLERLKAPEVLVEALNLLRKEFPMARAVFAGRSSGQREGLPYREWVERLASVSEVCSFLGQIPRGSLVEQFRNARVFVLPSWFENFPMAALEAMASGRPVVVTRTTGIAELVEGYGLGGVFPAGDPKALADALRPFLESAAYAAEIGERARAFVRESLDPDRIAAKRESAYRKAIARHEGHQRSQTRFFPYGLPKQVGPLHVPERWRKWIVTEVVDTPWKHFYIRTAEHLLELLAQHPKFSNSASLAGTRILDVGCTPALDVLLLSMGADVVVLDSELRELDKAKTYAHDLGVEDQLEYVHADALEPPFGPGAFDIVWNSGFIEHFDDPVRIVREMALTAQSGGAVVVFVPNLWTPHSLWIRKRLRRSPGGFYWDFMGQERSYTKEQLESILEYAGLRVVACSTSNLRRSLLDDSLVLPLMRRTLTAKSLFDIMNLTDWIEKHFPMTRHFGFMVGATGIVQG